MEQNRKHTSEKRSSELKAGVSELTGPGRFHPSRAPDHTRARGVGHELILARPQGASRHG